MGLKTQQLPCAHYSTGMKTLRRWWYISMCVLAGVNQDDAYARDS